jgi:hypothetical protein
VLIEDKMVKAEECFKNEVKDLVGIPLDHNGLPSVSEEDEEEDVFSNSQASIVK